MKLFDNITRVDPVPAGHLEDSFSYYNRSARVGVARIRDLLEEWFGNYPTSEQAELGSRIRADFDSVFFELFLHELLRRLGIEVTVHPEMPSGIMRRPDFGLEEGGTTSYLEARVAHDEGSVMTKQRKLMATMYDQINKIAVSDYFLRIGQLEVFGDRQPSTRRLRDQLQIWLQTLDYSGLVRSEFDSLDAFPSFRYEDDVFRVGISAIPVSEARRGDPAHRPIGIYPLETKWGGSETSLRKALHRKGVKYGKPDKPYIVAVNLRSSWGSDRIDQMEALFGTEEFMFGPGATEPVMVRKPNGFWQGPKGPQHTRVSAVLFCQVVPWNVHQAEACLYHNPWAAQPYGGSLTSLSQAVPQLPKMSWVGGADLGDMFGLSPDWIGE